MADVTLRRDAGEVLSAASLAGQHPRAAGAIERALIPCEGTLVTAAHLAIHTASERTPPPRHSEPVPPGAGSGARQELERKAIIAALERTHGHKSRAAAVLVSSTAA